MEEAKKSPDSEDRNILKKFEEGLAQYSSIDSEDLIKILQNTIDATDPESEGKN